MGRYATRADLEARLGLEEVARLGDANADGQEDLDVIEAAIADTDALISAHLVQRWPAYVGVSTVVLRGIAVPLIHEALARGPMLTQDITTRAERARVLLGGLARGSIAPDDSEPTDTAAAGEVEWQAGRREFSGGGY